MGPGGTHLPHFKFTMQLDKFYIKKFLFLQVGPSYGRKMMTGYIKQKHNLSIGEARIGKALSTVSPVYTTSRRTTARRAINPVPYRADYFGHKLHVDQNEKLKMYGVTHVAAIDGHSRFIVAISTMPVKNNVAIYEDI